MHTDSILTEVCTPCVALLVDALKDCSSSTVCGAEQLSLVIPCGSLCFTTSPADRCISMTSK